jgi:mRNA interferase RelE/StbE
VIWDLKFEPEALKQLKKLDRSTRGELVGYLTDRVAMLQNPRQLGKPLSGEKAGLWRYRVRDYRIICQIRDKELWVVVVHVGHRSTVYDD